MDHVDPFFVEVGILDLQKVVHCSKNVIITVKLAITELLLFGEEVVV